MKRDLEIRGTRLGTPLPHINLPDLVRAKESAEGRLLRPLQESAENVLEVTKLHRAS